MMIATRTTQNGFSLVETLVAISILLIAIVAPLTIASKSLQGNFLASEQYTATMLAQEGIEAVVSIQRHAQINAVRTSTDTAWDWYATMQAVNPTCTNDSQGCPIDMRAAGVEPAVVGTNDCSTFSSDPNVCRIWEDGNTTGDRAYFNHIGNVSGASSTPYSRSIKVIDVGGGVTEQVLVESTVFWDSQHFPGGTASVTVRSTLFNTATTTVN